MSQTLTIATWNVNSVRARLEAITGWLAAARPDVVLMQEIKVATEQFPAEPFEDLGYNLRIHGQKSYNGVGVLSLLPVDEINPVLPELDTPPAEEPDTHARYLEAVISVPSGVVRVASVYAPNGQAVGGPAFAYKLRFFERLRRHAAQLLTYHEPLVLGGDYNIAPGPLDVHDLAAMEGQLHYSPPERAAFQALLGVGLYDAYREQHPDSRAFSWWDYRAGSWERDKGLRIDQLLLSGQAMDRLESCAIHKDVRGGDKPSDHAPVTVTLRL